MTPAMPNSSITAPTGAAADLARAYEDALRAEAAEPTAAAPYLDLVDRWSSDLREAV